MIKSNTTSLANVFLIVNSYQKLCSYSEVTQREVIKYFSCKERYELCQVSRKYNYAKNYLRSIVRTTLAFFINFQVPNATSRLSHCKTSFVVGTVWYNNIHNMEVNNFSTERIKIKGIIYQAAISCHCVLKLQITVEGNCFLACDAV